MRGVNARLGYENLLCEVGVS